jgi:outer membrane protein TolC
MVLIAAAVCAAQPAAPVPEAAKPARTALRLKASEAVLMALERNRALAVERASPIIRQTYEQQERAAFDPTLTGQAAFERERADLPGDTANQRSSSQSYSGEVGVREFLPTGTTLGLTGGVVMDQWPSSERLRYASEARLSVTQSLLRGLGIGPNLARLRQARLDTESSEFELRGFTESLVAQTEDTYWDYVLALRQIEIYTQSLGLAEQQLGESRERIRVGRLAETELVAAEAEVALRREDLIRARGTQEKTRLLLLRLLNPDEAPFDREVSPEDAPTPSDAGVDPLADHLQAAERLRPDLNQARLQVRRGDLEIVRTRNGLLPKMDLFVNLGYTGYSRSFGESVEKVGGGNQSFAVGVNMEYPLGNRSAEAQHRRARYTRAQADDSLKNLAQLAEVDVRTAHIEILRTREQAAATVATRKLQAEKLRAEVEKFRVGKSTSFQVAQAQRDLVSSEINEVQAAVAWQKAIVGLYRLDGTLLSRRGIDAPGRTPPDGRRGAY